MEDNKKKKQEREKEYKKIIKRRGRAASAHHVWSAVTGTRVMFYLSHSVTNHHLPLASAPPSFLPLQPSVPCEIKTIRTSPHTGPHKRRGLTAAPSISKYFT